MIPVLLFIARAWAQISSVILLLVAGRLLKIEEFGQFTLASTIALFMNQFMCVGTSEYVIRHPDKPDAPDTSFWVNVGLALLYIVGGVVIALGSGTLLKSPQVMMLTLMLVPLSLFVGIRGVGGSILLRDGKLGTFAFTNMAVESAGLAMGVFALLTHWGVFALVASRWVQSISGIGFVVAARWHPKLRFSRVQAREMMQLWRSMIADRGLAYFQNYGADLLLGFFMTPAAVAIYRMGARIVALVTTIIYDPMRQLNWRVLTISHAREGTVLPATEVIIGALYLLIVGPILLLGLTGGTLAGLALGPQWFGIGNVIMLLAIAVLLGVPQQLSEPAYGVTGAIGRLPIQRIVTLSVSLTLLVVFARYGPMWAAASQTIAAVVAFIVTIVFQNRVLGLHPRRYIMNFGLAIIVAALALAGAEAVRRSIGHTLPGIFNVALMIMAGLCIYVGVIFLTGRRTILRLADLVGQKN